MATENPGKLFSATAGADLSAKQFCFVKVSAARTVVAAGNGERAIGVLQDKPTSGKIGAVMLDGISKILFGGTVAAGDLISADANGAAVVPATGEAALGICLVGGAAGEVGEGILKNYGAAP